MCIRSQNNMVLALTLNIIGQYSNSFTNKVYLLPKEVQEALNLHTIENYSRIDVDGLSNKDASMHNTIELLDDYDEYLFHTSERNVLYNENIVERNDVIDKIVVINLYEL